MLILNRADIIATLFHKMTHYRVKKNKFMIQTRGMKALLTRGYNLKEIGMPQKVKVFDMYNGPVTFYTVNKVG